MSSAIEVLKEIRITSFDKPATSKLTFKEINNALKEALLALEKQESDKILFLTLNKENAEFRKERAKLKEWLEKEIQYFEMRIGDKDFPNALGFRNKLREVKERIGEQK
jgi:ribosome recycling factor